MSVPLGASEVTTEYEKSGEQSGARSVICVWRAGRHDERPASGCIELAIVALVLSRSVAEQ